MIAGDDVRRLARHLVVLADDLDERGYPLTGTHRQAANALLELLAERRPDASEPRCPTCGGPVVQPTTGRRRVYCTPACRHRARNSAKADAARDG